MSNKSENLGMLQDWLVEAEGEVNRLRAESLELQARLTAAEEKADLLRRLLGLEESSSAAKRRASGTKSRPETGSATAAASALATELEPAVEAIIREGGAPVHISEIRERLVERGVPLPGRGAEANIIIRLRRAGDKFVRTGRGTYGLVELAHQEVLPSRPRLVSRRRGI